MILDLWKARQTFKTIKQNLISYWDFQNNHLDTHGSNNLTQIIRISDTWASGKHGNALDPYYQYGIHNTPSTFMNSRDWTLGYWIFVPSASYPLPPTGNIHLINMGGADAVRFLSYIGGSTSNFYFAVDNRTTTNYLKHGTGLAINDRWIFILASYSHANSKIVLRTNSIEIEYSLTVDMTDNITYSKPTIFTVGHAGSNTYKIDSVFWYNRFLNYEERSLFYNFSNGITYPDLETLETEENKTLRNYNSTGFRSLDKIPVYQLIGNKVIT